MPDRRSAPIETVDIEHVVLVATGRHADHSIVVVVVVVVVDHPAMFQQNCFQSAAVLVLEMAMLTMPVAVRRAGGGGGGGGLVRLLFHARLVAVFIFSYKMSTS